MKLFIILSLLFMLESCGGNRISENGSNSTAKSRSAVRTEGEADNAERQTETKEEPTVLAEVSTPLLDASEARLDNINIACGAVNGTDILSGGSFSFNDIVGRRTEERGYRDAPVIIDGHSEQGCGGGVCQVSSTLYMAAYSAGLEIVERHPHSSPVPYAPNRMDATVVSGEKDLRFTNNTDSTITIYVWTDGNEVFSKITKKTS